MMQWFNMNILKFFAAEEGPHISFKAEDIFHIGDFTVTNSMLYGLVVAIGLIITGLIAAKAASRRPKGGITQFFEMGLDFIVDMTEGALGSKKLAYKYAPTFATFFFFIVFSNLSGLVPLVGEGFMVGEATLFRPFTADLNGTLAMAIIAIILVQAFSIRESGILGHLKHYFTDKPLNPINLFIGVLEIFGELSRVVSLSLRLFLNTAIGEVLIAIFIFLGGAGGSLTMLPIAVFEMLVAFIQAYVFTVLAANYLGLAIAHHDVDHDVDHDSSNPDTELMLEHELSGGTS